MKKQIIAATIMLGLTSIAAAQTVVTVNGTKIDSKEIDSQVSMLINESHNQIQDTPQLRKSITSRLITRTLLIQAAKKQKLDQDPDFLNALAQAEAEIKKQGEDKKTDFNEKWAIFKDNLLTDTYLAYIVKNNPVKPEAVQAAYKNLVNHYTGTQEILLGEILTRDADTANRAIQELNTKQKFSAVAKKYTIDPAGRDAGGIPQSYVALKDLQTASPPVYDAIKNLKKGQYTTTPVQGNNGIYAVFYINNIRNLKIPTQKEIAPILTRRLQSDLISNAIEQLYQNASIKN